MTATTQRIEWIDTLKGFLLILVCLGHIAPRGTLFYDLMSLLRPFRMPCFFFLSGLLFSNRRTFTEYFKDKTRSLLLPYIWLSLLFCFLNPRLYDSHLLAQFPDTSAQQYHWLTYLFHPSILQSGLGINTLGTIEEGGGILSYFSFEFIRIVLLGRSSILSEPLWFVFTLYQTSLLYYTVQLHKRFFRIFVLALIFTTDLILLSTNKTLPLNIQNTFTAFLFFYAGAWCKPYLQRIPSTPVFLFRFLLPLLACAYFIAASRCGDIYLYINSIQCSFPLFLFTAFCGIGLFTLLFMYTSHIQACSSIFRVFRFISQNALVILPLHMACIQYCQIFMTPYVPHYRTFACLTGSIMAVVCIVLIPVFRGPCHTLLMKKRISLRECYQLLRGI